CQCGRLEPTVVRTQGVNHRRARDVAGHVTAEAIRHGEQCLAQVQGVLVAASHQTHMGTAGGLDADRHCLPAGLPPGPGAWSGQGSRAVSSRCRMCTVSTRSLATMYSVTSTGWLSEPDVPIRTISSTGRLAGIYNSPASSFEGIRARWISIHPSGQCPA